MSRLPLCRLEARSGCLNTLTSSHPASQPPRQSPRQPARHPPSQRPIGRTHHFFRNKSEVFSHLLFFYLQPIKTLLFLPPVSFSFPTPFYVYIHLAPTTQSLNEMKCRTAKSIAAAAPSAASSCVVAFAHIPPRPAVHHFLICGCFRFSTSEHPLDSVRPPPPRPVDHRPTPILRSALAAELCSETIAAAVTLLCRADARLLNLCDSLTNPLQPSESPPSNAA